MLVQRKKLWEPWVEVTDSSAVRDDRRSAFLEYDQKVGEQSDGLIPLTMALLPEDADVPQARKEIKTAMSGLLEREDPSACLGPDAPTKRSSRACDEYLKTVCGTVGLKGRSLSRVAVTDDYDIVEKRITTAEEFAQEDERLNPPLIAKLNHAVCSWAVAAGVQLEQEHIKLPDEPKWVSESYYDLTKNEPENKMVAFCKSDAQASFIDLARMESLARRLPKTSYARARVTHWRQIGESRLHNCQVYFAARCKNVYFVKDTPVLSYLTVQCRPRDVTTADVEADAKAMDTEAQRLGHLLMRDLLQLCQSGSEEGFAWKYVEPTTKGCRPSRTR